MAGLIRYVLALSFDRQCRVQTCCAGAFHQFRDVLEPVPWGDPVVAQCFQRRSQFPGRLTSGLADRQQGLRHLFALLASHVDGGLGLHLDHRNLLCE